MTGDEWFARLAMEPIDLAGSLRACQCAGVVDIFAREPVPKDVTIPRHQIYTRSES